jgi:hypothetical protein
MQRLGLSPSELLQNGAAAPSAPWPSTSGNNND